MTKIDVANIKSEFDKAKQWVTQQKSKIEETKNAADSFNVETMSTFVGEAGDSARAYTQDVYQPLVGQVGQVESILNSKLTSIQSKAEGEFGGNGAVDSDYVEQWKTQVHQHIKNQVNEIDQLNNAMQNVADIVALEKLSTGELEQVGQKINQSCQETIEKLTAFDTSSASELQSVDAEINKLKQMIDEVKSKRPSINGYKPGNFRFSKSEESFEFKGNQSKLLREWSDAWRPPTNWAEIDRIKHMIQAANPNYDWNDNNKFGDFLVSLNSEGCGYVAAVNLLMNKYQNNPKGFKEKYGYDMSDKNVYDKVLIDFYTKEKKQSELPIPIIIPGFDGGAYAKSINHPGLFSEEIERALLDYQGIHGDNDKVPVEKIDTNKISDYVKNGKRVVVTTLIPDWANPPKSTTGETFDMHSFTIVGVAENGDLKIESWGESYDMNPNELQKIGVDARAYY